MPHSVDNGRLVADRPWEPGLGGVLQVRMRPPRCSALVPIYLCGDKPVSGNAAVVENFMAIFRQTLVIEAPFPVDVARQKLLAVVKTDLPACARCGQILAGAGARFCSNCGQAVIAEAALPRPWLLRAFSSRQGFEFEGMVSPQGFRISRIISYRNSCIPILSGRFEPFSAGTRIVIEMKMHPLGWVFLVGGMGISCFVPALIILGGGRGSGVLAPAALVAPCFIGMVCWLAFAAEAGIARGAMNRIWESAPPLAGR